MRSPWHNLSQRGFQYNVIHGPVIMIFVICTYKGMIRIKNNIHDKFHIAIILKQIIRNFIVYSAKLICFSQIEINKVFINSSYKFTIL